MSTFGDRVAALRYKTGMTQIELAEKMGVEQASVSRWEKDGATPDFHKVKALAEILDCSALYLIGEEGAEPPNNIRALRQAKDLTIQQLAELVDTSNQQIQRLETGARRLTDTWMKRVAKALDVEPAAIMSGYEADDGLSQRLRAALAAVGISQSELGRRVGLSAQAIQHIVSGNTSKTKYATEIAKALGVAAEWLVSGAGEMGDPVAWNPSGAAPEDDVTASIRLPEGAATLTIPPNLSAASIDDLEAWIAVTLRAMRRAAT